LNISPKGIAFLQGWEKCKLKAYPDPGSRDGTPWTIGWGATGPGITRGTVWTQEQADARFAKDIAPRVAAVNRALGADIAHTTQDEFDALVSFHYNTGAIGTATLTKKHKAGDHLGAIAEFRKWNKNDGKVMKGLINRRAAEIELYRGNI